jgi:protease IV
MKRWFWGVLTGIFLTMTLFAVVTLLAWRIRGRPPEVRSNSTLVLDLHGELPEQQSPDIPGQLFGSHRAETFLSLIQDIGKASSDARITAILVEPSQLEMGWAQLDELRSALDQFKRGGKRVLSLIGEGGSREYFLSSVADKVYLSPVGFLDLKGMRAEVMFFKDTLGKLGVQADLEHIGRYKNFSDQFTDNRMSDSFREAENAVLDSIYGNFINTIAAARHRPSDEMRILIEETGPFEAERAVRLGIVDGLRYEDQILEDMKNENPGREPHRISWSDYDRVPEPDTGSRERLALVYAVGTIAPGEDSSNPVEGGKTVGAVTMATVLDDVAKDKSIKGVIVRIDSPGGDAFASDEIWRAMTALHKKKPVVISMSDLAASGGYYMAMTGDPIVSEPGTLTGSIGIVYGKLNLKGLYDKIGIAKEILTRGKFAAMDSDYAAYTPEERERVRALMADFYTKFVAKVAAARKMKPEAVDKIAQGRVWTGEQAKANGLVDELGGLSRAVELLKPKAGLRPDARVELIEYPARKTLLELLLSRAQEKEMSLPFGISNLVAQWRRIEQVSHSPLLARMPYAFDFR